jgi:hypothetical protein
VCAFDGTTDVLATEQACAAEAIALASCADAGAPDGAPTDAPAVEASAGGGG